MTGHARDYLTPPRGAPRVVAEATSSILASSKREIIEISTFPARAEAQRLVGARGGGHSRILLGDSLADEKARGTPLHLLLDDFAGASLVAGWAWSRWVDDWSKLVREKGAASTAGKKGVMEGICAGFRPGSSALRPDGTGRQDVQSAAPVVSLANPDDPYGWHHLAEQEGVGMRRARRLDVWREDGTLHMDVGFQDSATSPTGGRVAIHEYHIVAAADAVTHELRTLNADPRVLPYAECPSAAPNAQRMLGVSLEHMRQSVLDTLPGTLGCTHLNDVLRSLADAPILARALDEALH